MSQGVTRYPVSGEIVVRRYPDVLAIAPVITLYPEGGVEPVELVATADEGVLPGAPLSVTGGVEVAYVVGAYALMVEDNVAVITPYMFIINDVPTEEWFVSPTTLPADLETGDTVQVRDVNGNLSNILVAA